MDRKSKTNFRETLKLGYRLVNAVVDPFCFQAIFKYLGYFRDLRKYENISGAEKIRLYDLYPRLLDNTTTSCPIDWHYFYQDIWAFKCIQGSKVADHIDVGSSLTFIGFLSTIVKITFIDIRPFSGELDNIESLSGSILKLPYPDSSVRSLSCLHVVEHIGLGRYGDPIDPKGTIKAIKELERVLAKGGDLYFSMPVGSKRVCFNAHRILPPHEIVALFAGLKLMEHSGIGDDGKFQKNVRISTFENAEYACGLFHFKKI
jgi:SAM-dependent methyltransferase